MKTSILLLMLSCLHCGCATIDAHQQPSSPAPYVGTGQAIKNTANSVFDYDYYGEVMVKAWDVPLCFVADTLLLPYDIYQTVKGR